ncbi:MAG: restriction endonuclease [Methylococcaceae bacterium]
MRKLILRPLKGTEAPIYVDGWINYSYLNMYNRNHPLAIKYVRNVCGVSLSESKNQVDELFEKGTPIEFEFEEEKLKNINNEEWFNWFLHAKCEFFTEYIVTDNPESYSKRIIMRDCESELLAYASNNISTIHELSPRKFEELVAAIFRNHGYDVQLTPQSRDGGFDILAVQHSKLTGKEVTLVECKRYHPERKVGISYVQRLLGSVSQNGANKGVLVTTSFFTKDALKVQQDSRQILALRDQLVLKEWIEALRSTA